MCCNALGSNSLCPFYYDAISDATLQAEMLAGRKLLCNPIFDRCDRFIETLQQAFELNSSTKAILVCPARFSNQWFIDLCENRNFKVVAYYPPGTKLFTGGKKTAPFSITDRQTYNQGTVEPIAVFELSDNHRMYPTVTLE